MVFVPVTKVKIFLKTTIVSCATFCCIFDFTKCLEGTLNTNINFKIKIQPSIILEKAEEFSVAAIYYSEKQITIETSRCDVI